MEMMQVICVAAAPVAKMKGWLQFSIMVFWIVIQTSMEGIDDVRMLVYQAVMSFSTSSRCSSPLPLSHSSEHPAHDYLFRLSDLWVSF